MLNQVSAFFDYFPRLSIPRGRIHLPEMKLPGAKNTALLGLAFFIAYKLYRSYQSLLNRVHELAKENIKTTKPIKTEVQKEPSTNTIVSDLDEEELYYSAEEDHESKPLPSTDTRTPLEIFKETFPGSDIKFKHQEVEKSLNVYLLTALFRIDKVASCSFNQSTNAFTLSYSAPMIFAATIIPQTLSNQMSWLWQFAVSKLLIFAPNIQISNEIKGQFVKTPEGVEIKFNPSSIFFENQPFFLESIVIPNSLQEELVSIKASHTSNPFNVTIPVGPQILAEAIDLNFPSQ